jgi:two-component system NtrC family sensor kinase
MNVRGWLSSIYKPLLNIHKVSDAPDRYLVLRRNITIIMLLVTILPLGIMAGINHFQYRKSIKNEVIDPLRVLLSKTRHSFQLFLEERLSTVRFVASAYSFEQLSDERTLARVFRVLKDEFEGFVDLGLIDANGVQIVYAGPYNLTGKDYSSQSWFQEVVIRDTYISDVFMGYRKFPHVAIAVQRVEEEGRNWILRATLDTNLFYELISAMGLDPESDAFIINQEGVLQTRSRYYGDLLEEIPFDLSAQTYGPHLVETVDPQGREVMVAYVGMEKPSFRLVVVKPRALVLRTWITLQGEMFFAFFAGVIVIIVIVMKLSDALVTNIKEADERREAAIHELEQTQKLSAIGRLAAGVAHEINNPLSIINEKSGLMKDLLAFSGDFQKKERFEQLVEGVIRSVGRCKTITHRLLGFARRKEAHLEELNLNTLIRDVIGFLEKEMVYRNIDLRLQMADEMPVILSDQGQLQQVFLNIMTNALGAVGDGGRITVTTWEEGRDMVGVSIQDNGAGMSEETIQRIFDPFFTTKKSGGTGLGLFITYGIVKKLDGDIKVHSKEGEGATFTVYLPKTAKPRRTSSSPEEVIS